jgi:dipeptidyl aminopeptidase/acylaminoacyl peptidase
MRFSVRNQGTLRNRQSVGEPFIEGNFMRGCYFLRHCSIISMLSGLIVSLSIISTGATGSNPGESGTASGNEANYQLFAEWQWDKLGPRIMSLNISPHWIHDSDSLWYWYRTSKGTSWYVADPEQEKKTELFDLGSLVDEAKRIAGTGPYDPPPRIDPGAVTLSDDLSSARFRAGEDVYDYDIATGTAERIDPAPSPDSETNLSVSPDGDLTVFSRGNNLYIAETADPQRSERRLTNDGTKDYWWDGQDEDTGNFPHVRGRVEAYWSGDSRRFCIRRYDYRGVGDLWLIDDLAEPRPTLKTFKCPLPGEQIPRNELWIYNRTEGSFVKIDTGRWPDQMLWDLFNPTTYWSDDGARLYFIRRSRDFLNVDLCAVDMHTMKTTILVEERMRDMVYFKPLVQLEEAGGFLWWSMRDGWGHIYYYKNDGTLIAQLTSGEYNVDDITAVDEVEALVYFTANGREAGRNPYYRHLYRVGLDGGDLRLLTSENAEHHISMSPSRRYFIDTYSTVADPPVSLMRTTLGEKHIELERTDASPLLDAGWRAPEVFSVKAADGVTDLWGVMWKPFDLDPSRKYPIVVRTYPGKQGEFIPHSFSPWAMEGVLAQLGFVVVNFGNRGGTPERGFAYRSHGRGDLRGYALADKKAGVIELAERNDFIDIDRVGIYGGSSGGYITATAMLMEPDLFKVGVAISGPHDGDIYYNIWHERYNGIRMVEAEGDSISWEVFGDTNIEIAGSLKGHLLIVQGGADQIVHPAHAARLADALIRAGKRFDFFMIPGANHGYSEPHQWRYLQRLTADYFAEYLIGDHRVDTDMFAADPDKPE